MVVLLLLPVQTWYCIVITSTDMIWPKCQHCDSCLCWTPGQPYLPCSKHHQSRFKLFYEHNNPTSGLCQFQLMILLRKQMLGFLTANMSDILLRTTPHPPSHPSAGGREGVTLQLKHTSLPAAYSRRTFLSRWMHNTPICKPGGLLGLWYEHHTPVILQQR